MGNEHCYNSDGEFEDCEQYGGIPLKFHLFIVFIFFLYFFWRSLIMLGLLFPLMAMISLIPGGTYPGRIYRYIMDPLRYKLHQSVAEEVYRSWISTSHNNYQPSDAFLFLACSKNVYCMSIFTHTQVERQEAKSVLDICSGGWWMD